MTHLLLEVTTVGVILWIARAMFQDWQGWATIRTSWPELIAMSFFIFLLAQAL